LTSIPLHDARHRLPSPPITSLPIDTRMEAFKVVLQMHACRLRPIEIWKELLRRGLEVKYNTVLSWVNGERNPARKLRLIANKGGYLVELIGLVAGDGNLQKIMQGKAYAGGLVSYASKDLELAQRAGILLAKVLGRSRSYKPYWSKTSRIYVVQAGSKQLVEMIADGLAALEPLVLKYPLRFLKGIFDAEGCPNVKIKSCRLYPRVFLTNSDQEILRLTEKLLHNLGIQTTLELNTRAGKAKRILGKETVSRVDVYNICIGRFEMVQRFSRLIGFRISTKQSLLRRVVRAISRYGTDGAYSRVRLPSLR
jgi:intein-encoded DNA endonuclease-like protein